MIMIGDSLLEDIEGSMFGGGCNSEDIDRIKEQVSKILLQLKESDKMLAEALDDPGTPEHDAVVPDGVPVWAYRAAIAITRLRYQLKAANKDIECGF
jgi:hypothetical protein